MLLDRILKQKWFGFNVNKQVKSFILAETFLWSGWNFFFPLIGVFVITKVEDASLELVSIAYSFYLSSRIIFEIISGKYFVKRGDKVKLVVTVVGTLILGLAYLGFLVSDSALLILLVYILIGAGIGIASPAKYSLFSMHLDKNKEASEWSYYDAVSFGGMAISGAIGGFVASIWGFEVLFIVASLLNLIGVLPYIYLLGKYRN